MSMPGTGASMTDNFSSQADDRLRFEPYEFVSRQQTFAVLLLVVVGVAGVVGTFGNFLILISVATRKELRNVQSVFIVNLACSDLYVTMLADPLSIVAKTVGWRWFDTIPYLCRAVGSLCTISCVGSLMTLSAMSFNRYVLICRPSLYPRLFTLRNSIAMCASVYTVGLLLVLLNLADVGDHSFDHKSLECIWDRMANHNYTIVFAIVLVWIPIVIIGLSYLHIFLHVRASRKKLLSRTKGSKTMSSETDNTRTDQDNEMGTTGSGATETQKDSRAKQLMHVFGAKENPSDGAGANVAESAEKLKGRGPPFVSFNISEGLARGRSVPDSDTNATEESDTAAGGETSATFTDGSRDFSSQHSETEDGKTESSLSSRKRTTKKKLKKKQRGSNTTFRVARTLFILYLVFAACWLPYSLLLILDADDTYSHEAHSTIVVWAHLHPSINWLIYYCTYSKFRQAFRSLLRLDRCC